MTGNSQPNSSTATLEVEDLHKSFGDLEVLKGVSMSAREGDVVSIVGSSGSGKSTFLRCINLLELPTSGSIRLSGEEVKFKGTGAKRMPADKKQVARLRSQLGMVFQSFALLPHKTVLENIAFPLQVKGISTSESMKRAQEMIDLVSLSGRENYFPRELSGGQQQRVGIARSLAIEPDIWFLDEPFSALDPLIRREMQDEFLRLQESLNKTILFVTHDFDEALRLADRIAGV